MKLRTKKSYFQNLPEGQAPLRFWPRVFKFLYFALLISIAVGILCVFVMRAVYFKGNGQVEIEKHKLSALDSGRLVKLYKLPGEYFKAGQPLAQIDLDLECRIDEPDIRPTQLAYDIKKMEADLKVYRSQLDALEEIEIQMPEGILYRALEVGAPVSSSKEEKEILLEKDQLKKKIELLTAEIRVRKWELTELKRLLSGVKTSSGCETETIFAPFEGVVDHITRKQGEFVGGGEPLLTVISKKARVTVEAYVSWKTMKYLKRGKTLTVTFPDGTKTRGIITEFKSVASQSVELIKKNYLPVESKPWILLVPGNEKDRQHWIDNDRVEVRITGGKL